MGPRPWQSLAEQLFRVTVRIHTETKVGTGFLFQPEQGKAFLVTNRHVIQGANSVTCLLAVEGAVQHTSHDYRMDPAAWHPHPDLRNDVAVSPLEPIVQDLKKYNISLGNQPVPSGWIPAGLRFAEIDAIEEILFIGYPKGFYDKVNNYPIARRGITATPFMVDYEGTPKFLIDAEVFPGSSGSPVFLYNAGAYTNRFGGTVSGRRCLFLGIISEYFPLEGDENPKEGEFRHALGLGIVYRPVVISECISDFLQSNG